MSPPSTTTPAASCPHCGKTTKPGSAFCQHCGQRIAMDEGSGPVLAPGRLPEPSSQAPCPACGTPNPAQMNFCKQCGEALRPTAQQTPASTTPGGMAPVVGPATPAPARMNRAALPSALAAVVGSGTPAKRGPSPTPTTTLRKPMIAATPVPEKSPPPAVASGKPMRTCASCSAQTPVGFSFCQQCGAKLESEPTVETQAPSTMTDAVADTLAGSSDIVPLVKKRAAASLAPWGRLISVQRDGSDGQAHPLVEESTDLGRSDGGLLFEDRFLAPRHARIERRAAGVVALVPLDNTNGVYARLRAGETYPLVDGDHLLIGKEVLRFEVVEPEERALGPAVQHGVRLFGSPVRAPWGRLRQIVQTGASRDIYHLSAAQVVLGREEGDLRFADDEFMSRRHARITNRDGRFEANDLDSSNGTFARVRGERVLRPGDLIRLGDQLLRFEPVSP